MSEPEIQRSGRDQISIGLPDVQNAQRAIEQVGTTAQLQFYDWEPNVLGDRGPDVPYAGSKALYDAVEVASKQKPKAEKDRRAAGLGPHARSRPTSRTTRTATSYYLFGPDRYPIGPDKKPLREGDYEPSASCKELLADYEPASGAPHEVRRRTRSARRSSRRSARPARRPARGCSRCPQGVVVVEAEPAPEPVRRVQALLRDRGRLGALRQGHQEPRAEVRPEHERAARDDGVHGQGPRGLRAGDQADRRARRDCETLAGVYRTARRQRSAARAVLPALRDHARQPDRLAGDDRLPVDNPEGIDGRTGAQIEGIGTIQETQDLAESLRIGALPIELKLISQTQVSATLGQQALDQGLIAGAAGLALTILFLLVFYRVLGLVATVALLIYAVMLFALVKLIPITLTLPGIAGLVLTLAVAADANIVMYERIKEEVRDGRSMPAAISAGYSKALRTIIDANVVTIGVAFILFTLATAGVKGFAFTLGVGTIVSLFTAVLATSAILGTLARTRLLRRPSALGVATKESKGWKFDFMGNSRWFFSFSGVILAGRRDRDRGRSGSTSASTSSPARGSPRRSSSRRASTRCATRSTRSATPTRRSRRSTIPSSARTWCRSRSRSSTRARSTKVEQALDKDFGVAAADFSTQLGRADLRRSRSRAPRSWR